MSDDEIIFNRLAADPLYMQTHTELIRRIVKAAKEEMQNAIHLRCREMRQGVQCQLEWNHKGDHIGTMKWRGDAGSYCKGNHEGDDDN